MFPNIRADQTFNHSINQSLKLGSSWYVFIWVCTMQFGTTTNPGTIPTVFLRISTFGMLRPFRLTPFFFFFCAQLGYHRLIYSLTLLQPRLMFLLLVSIIIPNVHHGIPLYNLDWTLNESINQFKLVIVLDYPTIILLTTRVTYIE